MLLAGCGYQPYGESGLPPGIRRLHLSTLTNDTFRPGLHGVVSAAIRRLLQQDGRVNLTDEATADAILAGILTTYQNDAVAFERPDIGRRFRVRLILAVTLTERRGNRVLLQEELAGEAFYTTGAGVVATRAAEEEASVRAAQDLAARLVARVMEGL